MELIRQIVLSFSPIPPRGTDWKGEFLLWGLALVCSWSCKSQQGERKTRGKIKVSKGNSQMYRNGALRPASGEPDKDLLSLQRRTRMQSA